ncbi:MAG: 2-oxoacid:acceptor oxidoreductase family protein [Anaerolineae bacterium]|jgi:2-oxoglutarate ferredoxin oxidoreductase subunit gamma
MSRHEIRLSGFGGQGIVTAGYILGKGAALHDDKHVTLTKSYGPESRGGACSAQVMIADEAIDYPQLIAVDLLVVMSQEAYDKYGDTLPSGGLMLIDEDLVDLDRPRDDIEVRSIPATRIAERDLGRKIVANIVMLGFVAANSDAVSSEAIRESVLESVPKGTEELNARAFDAGFAYAKETQPATA